MCRTLGPVLGEVDVEGHTFLLALVLPVWGACMGAHNSGHPLSVTYF